MYKFCVLVCSKSSSWIIVERKERKEMNEVDKWPTSVLYWNLSIYHTVFWNITHLLFYGWSPAHIISKISKSVVSGATKINPWLDEPCWFLAFFGCFYKKFLCRRPGPVDISPKNSKISKGVVSGATKIYPWLDEPCWILAFFGCFYKKFLCRRPGPVDISPKTQKFRKASFLGPPKSILD